MRIVKIEVFLVQVEVQKPYVLAFAKHGLTKTSSVIVRMHAENGHIGLGESDPFVGFSEESPESVMENICRYIGPAVLGMDPRNLVRLHLKMDSVMHASPFTKAPIDIAAHDLWGRTLSVPVYQLLGGRVRDEVPMIWPIGGGTVEENVLEAREKVAEGYETLHIKLGAAQPEQDIARLKAIREAIGNDIHLMADVNQGWDRSISLQVIPQLEKYGLSLIEQPVPSWDIESLAKIQAAVETRISADESLNSTHQAINLIRHNAVRAFSLKIGKCGGFFRTRQIAAIIESAGLLCFVNSMIELGISVAASLHLAATVPNLVNHGHALMSNLRIKEDLLPPNSFQYAGKNMLVPRDCRGLGITIDEQKLEKMTLERFVLEL